MMQRKLLTERPSWVLRNAAFDLDFENGRWWGGVIADRTNFGSLITISNAGANGAYGAVDRTGTKVLIYDANRPRVVPGVGLYVEGSRTNRLLHNRDLTQAAWVATSCTVSRNQPGADWDGTANTGSLITATAGGGTVLQAITLASSTVISSGFVRRGSGTGTVEITQDGGASYSNITSQLGTGSYVRVNTGAATVTNPQVGFRLGTSGDSIVVDFMQCEQAATVSSPIVTTTTTRGRGSEMPSFGDDGTSYNDGQRLIDTTHFNRMPLSQYVAFNANFDGVTIANVKGGGNYPTARIQVAADYTVQLRTTGSGVSLTTANTVANGIGNTNKVATRQHGGGGAVCLNGGAIASGTDNKIDTTNTTDDHLGIGNNGAGLQPLNGYIRRMAFWRRELTDGEMLELTR